MRTNTLTNFQWPVLVSLGISICGWMACGSQTADTPDQRAPSPDGAAAPGSTGCLPLAAPTGATRILGPDDDLAAAMDDAAPGLTLLLEDATYNVPSSGLWIRQDGVTLRSLSGNPDAVILDGNYGNTSGGVINISGASDVTLAELTVRRSRYHAVHLTGAPSGATLRPRLYRIVASDAGEQAIKINSNYGFDTDGGEIACSRLELSDAGRDQVMSYTSSNSQCYTGGVDAHRARDWVIRDNVIEGFWCSNDFISEHGIHFWNGGRDTKVMRNLLIDNARAIGFGLLESPSNPRNYDDAPCGEVNNAGHYGGTIQNNMIVATRTELFASPYGMDLGIGLNSACNASILHNTVASTAPPFSSIEWRFEKTTSLIANNLVTHNLRERGGQATLLGNMSEAPPEHFEDLPGHDLHLSSSSTAVDAAASLEGLSVQDDFDREVREPVHDVGADERGF